MCDLWHNLSAIQSYAIHGFFTIFFLILSPTSELNPIFTPHKSQSHCVEIQMNEMNERISALTKPWFNDWISFWSNDFYCFVHKFRNVKIYCVLVGVNIAWFYWIYCSISTTVDKIAAARITHFFGLGQNVILERLYANLIGVMRITKMNSQNALNLDFISEACMQFQIECGSHFKHPGPEMDIVWSSIWTVWCLSQQQKAKKISNQITIGYNPHSQLILNSIALKWPNIKRQTKDAETTENNIRIQKQEMESKNVILFNYRGKKIQSLLKCLVFAAWCHVSVHTKHCGTNTKNSDQYLWISKFLPILPSYGLEPSIGWFGSLFWFHLQKLLVYEDKFKS